MLERRRPRQPRRIVAWAACGSSPVCSRSTAGARRPASEGGRDRGRRPRRGSHARDGVRPHRGLGARRGGRRQPPEARQHRARHASRGCSASSPTSSSDSTPTGGAGHSVGAKETVQRASRAADAPGVPRAYPARGRRRRSGVVRNVRDLDIEDLLGRKQVVTDLDAVGELSAARPC